MWQVVKLQSLYFLFLHLIHELINSDLKTRLNIVKLAVLLKVITVYYNIYFYV